MAQSRPHRAVVGDVVLVEGLAGPVGQRRGTARRPSSRPSSGGRLGDDAARCGRGTRWRPRPGRPWPRHGSSGGASGSSQSPNWKPVSHEPGRREQTLDPPDVRGHRVVLPLEHRPVAVGLPQRPRHPDRGVAPDRGAVRVGELLAGGAVLEHVRDDERHHAVGVLLLQGEVDAASRARNGRTSNRNAAEGANTAMSPVQPSRSSRCGQSVGTSRKLPARPPDDVAVELVEQGVGALEGARSGAGRSGRRRPRAIVGRVSVRRASRSTSA